MDADGIHLLDSINLEFPVGSDVAIVGHGNSGRNFLPQFLRPACATMFSLAYVIGRGARLIPAQCRLRAGSGRSKRRGNRETANSILRPTGSTISKRVWRTRRRWSHGSSRCCVPSISRKTSSVSGCAAESLRSSNRKLHSTSSKRVTCSPTAFSRRSRAPRRAPRQQPLECQLAGLQFVVRNADRLRLRRRWDRSLRLGAEPCPPPIDRVDDRDHSA